MQSNAYFLAKVRFDTAENEPAKNVQNNYFGFFLQNLPIVPRSERRRHPDVRLQELRTLRREVPPSLAASHGMERKI